MKIRLWVAGAILICLIAAGWGGYEFGRRATQGPVEVATAPPPPARPPQEGAQLVEGRPDTVRLSNAAFKALDIKLAAVKQAPPDEKLLLTGSLLIDPNRLAYVHSRFSGEVVSIGTIAPTCLPRISAPAELQIVMA